MKFLHTILATVVLMVLSFTPLHGRNTVSLPEHEESPDSLSSQSENRYEPSVSDDILNSAQCVGFVLSSPLRWSGTDALLAGGITLGFGAGVLLDDEVRSLVLRNHSTFNDDGIVPLGNTYATVFYAGPSALALYLSGAALKNQWMRETGQMLLEGVATIGILQVPLSIATGRARPLLNEGNTSFKLFGGADEDRASFFSGHSMVAFTFSTILARQIDNPWVSAGLYTIATLGPFARLYKDKHWFSDVCVGSMLGVLVGNSICDWHQGGGATGSDIGMYPGGQGLVFVWKF